MTHYRIIGMMSGTSLDAIDLAYVHLQLDKNGKWSFELKVSDAIPYPDKWKVRLGRLMEQNALTYLKTHTYYGHYMAEVINDFIDRFELRGQVDLLSLHGHTVYHYPQNKLTAQIGDGAVVAVKTGVPVACNFRTSDIAAGGQGAPLAPLVDQLLFHEHLFCVNLGGISNISVKTTGENGESGVLGYDVSGCNITLNYLAGLVGMDYDHNGELASKGRIDEELLDRLNELSYYKIPPPKSLAARWVRATYEPILKLSRLPVQDQLATMVEHIAIQLGNEVDYLYERADVAKGDHDSLLLTGGGAHNDYLLSRIAAHCDLAVIRPDADVVDMKESILMALLGALRLRNEANCMAAVTGAGRDTVGGALYFG